MSYRKTPFSERLNDVLVKTAMIDEMARADSWQGLDECLEIKPEVVKKLALYADAALRAIKQIEDVEKITLLNGLRFNPPSRKPLSIEK